MRYIKRQSTNTRSPAGKGVHYDVDDQVIVDSDRALVVPVGTTPERPGETGIITGSTNGQIRYNTDSNELETYQNGAWRKIRFKEPNRNPGIHMQTFTGADGVETIFGTLNSGDTDFPIPENEMHILVFVENVYQIPYTNYTIVQNPSGKPSGHYLEFGSAVPFGKDITVIHNFDK